LQIFYVQGATYALCGKCAWWLV